MGDYIIKHTKLVFVFKELHNKKLKGFETHYEQTLN